MNGQTKQDGTTADMLTAIPELISFSSGIMTLEEGDLLITGTPSGVGPIVAGDKVVAVLRTAEGKEIERIEVGVVDRKGGYEFKGL